MKNFKMIYNIQASPADVFNAMTNPVAIELWSGSPAIFDLKPGTEFELWNGDISGRNIELIKDEKIVQEWYFGDQPEKSIVTITLKSKGQNTIIQLEHTNIPDNEFIDIKAGWNKSYWNALKEFFK